MVITAVLSSIFLKERLSFVGKIGCFMCLVGSVVIVVNAPSQTSVTRIEDMKHFVLAPGFLSYAGVVILGCIGIVVWVAPKYGHKSMMVYITVCSLIGGLRYVLCSRFCGRRLIETAWLRPRDWVPRFWRRREGYRSSISGSCTSCLCLWFPPCWWRLFTSTYVLPSPSNVTQPNLEQKALNIYNAALVTPTYYVCFTSATIVTSAILFQGFKGSASSIATVVMGFLQICSGVVLLQLSKSAKDVPDTEIFRGDLDQVRTVAEQSEPESEPKADTIRGTAAIIRRISVARRTMEVEEAKRIHEARLRDLHSPASANESVEWDGVRRRVTFVGDNPINRRRNTLSGQHPPLGMSSTPAIPEEGPIIDGNRRRSMSVDEAMRRQAYPDLEGQLTPHVDEHEHPDTFLERVKVFFTPNHPRSPSPQRPISNSTSPAPLLHRPHSRARFDHTPPATITESPSEMQTYDFAVRPQTSSDYLPVTSPADPPSLRPGSGGAKRQFSFQNIMHRPRSSPNPVAGLDGTNSWRGKHDENTEEEMLGLVKGDSIDRGQEAEMRGLVRAVDGGAESDDEDEKRNWTKEKEIR